MVLYYNKVKKVEEPDPDDNQEEISKTYNLPAITTTTSTAAHRHMNSIPTRRRIFDEIYKTNFSNRKELYYDLFLEDDFNNLSVDDKLLLMHKTSIIRSNVTNNYILMCLAILVIITFKLYSK